MLAEKEELENHKVALLMKEHEVLKKEKEAQLELKKVQDIAQRVEEKVDMLQIPPPKYFFPPDPWHTINGVAVSSSAVLPQVFCRNC